MERLLKIILTTLFISTTYAAVSPTCLEEICDHLRAIEFATQNSLIEGQDLSDLVDDIENFKENYDGEDEYKAQLDLVFPKFKRFAQIKGRLNECQDDKLNPNFIGRILSNVLQAEEECASCNQSANMLPVLPNNLERYGASIGRVAQENKMIDDTKERVFQHGIGNLIDVEYRTNPNATPSTVQAELEESLCIEMVTCYTRACRPTRRDICDASFKSKMRSEINKRWRDIRESGAVRFQNKNLVYQAVGSIVNEVNGHFEEVKGTMTYDPDKHTRDDRGIRFEVAPGGYEKYAEGMATLFDKTSQDVGLLMLSPVLAKETLKFIKPLNDTPKGYSKSFWPIPQPNGEYARHVGDIEVYDYHMRKIPRLKDRTPFWQRSVIKKAIQQTKDAIKKNLKKSRSYVSDNFWEAADENPMAIAEVLVNDPSLANSICAHLIKASEMAEKEERTQNFLRYAGGVATAATIGLSIMTAGGAGAIVATVAVASGVIGGGASVAGAVITYNHLSDARSALASGTGDQEHFHNLPRLQKEFNSLVRQAVLEIGLTAFDVASLAKILKAGGLGAYVDDLNKLVKNLKGIGPAVRNMIFKIRGKMGQSRFVQFLKNLIKGSDDPKDLKKAIAFLDDASPEQTKRFTEMLDNCACGGK